MAVLPKIEISVISDSVCPWCFVGKRRLERAISKFSGRAQFEVRWHPFQLNPDAPEKGVNKLEMYKQKFGEARVNQMLPAMAKTFSEEGLTYKIGGLTGNTLNSHRLIAWAGSQGAAAQNSLVEELMLDYFTRELYINDREVLLNAVERAGLSRDGAAAVLDNPSAELAHVKAEIAAAQRKVTGVPFFSIEKEQISGAQSPDVFEAIIEAAIRRNS